MKERKKTDERKRGKMRKKETMKTDELRQAIHTYF